MQADERIRMILERKKKNDNVAIEIALRKEIAADIRAISTAYGGDDAEWLKGYIVGVFDLWKDDLRKAQECFSEQAHWVKTYGTRLKPMDKAR